MSAKTNDFYRRAAIGTCVLSGVTTVGLLVLVPLLCARASSDRAVIAVKAEKFRADVNRLWAQMHETAPAAPDSAAFFSRVRRSPWDRRVCGGCNQLSCPVGMPGAPGPVGVDGEAGQSGMPGAPGVDGFDVELEPQDDLPCVICPGGPPGQRGPQGERGESGPQGPKGPQGEDGRPGAVGPRGNGGRPGPVGLKGRDGPVGPPGETVISGVGIKGPKGVAGPQGPRGPMGRPGKASREAGMPGPSGANGPVGPPGAFGKYGDAGEQGPPGEPGLPSAYCPSDCGVSQILAPSVSQMMASASASNEGSSTGGGYADEAQPIHTVGLNNAYSGGYYGMGGEH
ncbi:Cuticle collagen lon-3 [Aphelenchoides fujianensis]|nr:Cuticle collagen lon-3 [Aphelenchoides fujianensis]